MIKKILILLSILFIFVSCGKKGDPQYTPKNEDKTLSN